MATNELTRILHTARLNPMIIVSAGQREGIVSIIERVYK
jgi:hypothetical protein